MDIVVNQLLTVGEQYGCFMLQLFTLCDTA